MINVIGDGDVRVGENCQIGSRVNIFFRKKGTFSLGDYVTLGDDVKVVIDGGEVSISDWTTIHNNTLLLSKKKLLIGRHCWFGQNSILDGTGGLTIDDGVRVGMYSQIWTHVAAGEQIEGCRLYSEKPTHIKKDVWLVGSCTIGSGIELGERVVCMNGANVTKSIPDHSVVVGAPGLIRKGLKLYKEISLDEKFNLIEGWISEFSILNGFSITKHSNSFITIGKKDGFSLSIYLFGLDFYENIGRENFVAFCVENKQYEKKYTKLEELFIRYLSGNKARFYPIEKDSLSNHKYLS